MSITTKFCANCGNGLIDSAVICPGCGSPTEKFQSTLESSTHKNKTTAVLLAVFLGAWGFLYLYKKDSLKFWISLWSQVPFGIFIALLPSAVATFSWVDGEVPKWMIWYTNNIVSALWLWALVIVSTWIWAILVQATRSHSTFRDFSKNQISV